MFSVFGGPVLSNGNWPTVAFRVKTARKTLFMGGFWGWSRLTRIVLGVAKKGQSRGKKMFKKSKKIY